MIQLVFEKSCLPFKITLDENRGYSIAELTQVINQNCLRFLGTTIDFYLLHNGKIYDENKDLSGTVLVLPRLKGGKGGFGSMLRAIGAQIEKTTNREACRDLSGRRLRDINEEKRLKKWIAEQAQREQEAFNRKKKKLEKLTNMVKHEIFDEDYTKARLEMSDKIHDSVEEGFKAAATSTATTSDNSQQLNKREEKTNDEPNSSCSKGKKNANIKRHIKKNKKIKGNLWVDDLEDLNNDSETSEEETPKKKVKKS